jgi:endoglucanase
MLSTGVSLTALFSLLTTASIAVCVEMPPDRTFDTSANEHYVREAFDTRPANSVKIISTTISQHSNQYFFSRGINLSGAELNLGQSPDTYGKKYLYPTENELDYYKGRGFEVARLPFRWERLQPSMFGELNQPELSRIKVFLAACERRGMKVILSPHNFGRYLLDGKEVRIGSPGVPYNAFGDFWRRLAEQFVDEPAIYAFSLMNEPHDSEGTWKLAAQIGLDAIRQSDQNRLVLVPGDAWSGAASWQKYNSDFLLHDPTGNIIYEAHQYFDLDHSGTYKVGYVLNGANPDLGVTLVRPFIEWLHKHRVRGIITEFGVPNDDPRWLSLVDRLLTELARENIPWVYWAGGPWWGNYPLSAEPKNGVDAPIMSVLTKEFRRSR